MHEHTEILMTALESAVKDMFSPRARRTLRVPRAPRPRRARATFVPAHGHAAVAH